MVKAVDAGEKKVSYSPSSSPTNGILRLIDENENAVKKVTIEMSNQNLVSALEDEDSASVVDVVVRTPKKYYIAVMILFAVNLLNYMDRYTIAGVLHEVKQDFSMDDSEAGLLQTGFIVSYMLFAPIFGYLGDRYSRKLIMVAGIIVWSTSVLLSSFVPSHHYLLFLLCRACVGIGEASYITVSPTIIADLFTKDMRSKMLMMFYFAVPVGSGLGYVVGSSIASLLGSWRWGVRVTPPLGLVCVLLIIFVLDEPKRGHAEKIDGPGVEASSYLADLNALVRTPSYVTSTIAFTCVAFVTGCLAWFTPYFVIYAVKSQGIYGQDEQIHLIFGLITCVSGLVGVAIGANWAKYWRRTNPRADPLVCGIGLLLSMPLLFVALNVVDKTLALAWPLIFCGITALCFNWSIISDILLYIVTPRRRATASAVQILISHLFGDAASPYLVGLVSDYLRRDDSALEHFLALKIALYINTFVLVLGGGFFLFTAWFVEKDKFEATKAVTVSTTTSSAQFPNSSSAAGLLPQDDVVVQGFTTDNVLA